MGTQVSLPAAIRSQERTVSIDIKETPISMSRCTGTSKVQVNKKTYQNTCLPFGLAPSRVHQATKTRSSMVEAARCQAARLLGQLADLRRFSRTDPDAFRDYHCATPDARMGYQLREVRPNTKSGVPVSGNAFQHSTVYSGAPAENAPQGPVSTGWATPSSQQRLLGMGVFMATLVRHGRLRLWPVQWWAATAWSHRTQRQKMVSFLPETGVLAKNQLPSQALKWITVPGIAPSWPRCTRENVMSSQTTQAISKGYRKNSGRGGGGVSSYIGMERDIKFIEP